MKWSQNRSGLLQRKRSTILFFILLGYVGNVFAQASQKQQYSEKLDSLWSIGTYISGMSANSQWVAFEEDFPNKRREVIISKTNGAKLFRLPESYALEFSADSKWFGCISNKKELILIDLESEKEERFSKIGSYQFSSDGNYVGMLQEGPANIMELLIIALKTNSVIRKIPGVTAFDWHPTENILLATTQERLERKLILLDVHKGVVQPLFMTMEGTIEYFDWNNSGTAAVFLSGMEGNYQLHYYNKNENIHRMLTNNKIQEKFLDYSISNRIGYLDNDGKKLIFYLKADQTTDESTTNDAENWKTEDPWIAPRMQTYKKQEESFLLMAWYPKLGVIREIETENLPSASMDINNEIAVVFNKIQYEPLYKFYPNADLYIKNIETGTTNLICRNQYTEPDFIKISPQGKYISYFKNNHWWVYNTASGVEINLTKDLNAVFVNNEQNRPGDAPPYGLAGWLGFDEQIIIYDQFDIWVMSPDGSVKERITEGKENSIQYRINQNYIQKISYGSVTRRDFWSKSFDLKKGIVLELLDYKDYKSGVGIWSGDNKIEHFLMVEGKIDQITSADNSELLVYRSQRFDRPISINSINIKTKENTVLYQTNERLMEYDLGTTEFIKYQLNNGTQMRGSLLYPTNYNPEKIYPMIVAIYERKSRDINNFMPPSNLMRDGFNQLKFTINGYFVLYPDIIYNIGNPGISALNAVNAAVEKVLETGKVDKERLGLIGHSFGGYETAFIITQTDIFAAAVAGAAITDMVNFYHEVNWDWSRTQMWRMENQQFRFGDSFYIMKESYYRNSPLYYVENIKTPLLLWAGKKDTNINWTQSVQMFLALKRLGKKSKMLLFKGENHDIDKSYNQDYLSRSIFDWMEIYLKESNNSKRFPVSKETGKPKLKIN